ncbi:zinc-binding dehydrogenase, partial [Streptomyces sp. GXMU-J15]
DVDIEKFTNVLNVIFELKPAVNDTHLAAPWLAVIAKAIAAFSKLAPIMCLQKLHTVIPIVTSYLSSDSQDIYSSASQCLIAIITQAVPDDFILDPPAVGFREAFAGRRVDVVLNSLAREFVDASLELLAPQGRFVEMGRTALRDPEELTRANPGMTYAPVELGEAGPERMGEILRTVVGLFEAGVLEPLPVRAWDV